MGRTLCVGDIHGGFKALKQVLERAELTIEDKIIFLGDYCDGWGETFELVDYLITLSETHDCVFIKGNHDVWADQWLSGGMIPVLGSRDTWRDRGGASTIKSYMERPPSDIEPHRTFFSRLHNYYEDLHNERVFVHGGYTQPGGVRFETQLKNLWWDRSLFEVAYHHERRYKDKPAHHELYYPTILKAHKEIFVGHTTTQLFETIQPITVCNVTNLDTGAGHLNGKLSIMDVDTKQYWQSDRLKELYPDDPQMEFMKHEGADLN